MVKNPRANGRLEHVHQVLGQMLHTAELDMANSVTPDDVDVFLDNAAWAICSTYNTRYLKPPQGQPFLDEKCSSTFHSWLTGAKLENEGNHQPIMAISARRLNKLTRITNLEIKY
jgi:hypothetical protein